MNKFLVVVGGVLVATAAFSAVEQYPSVSEILVRISSLGTQLMSEQKELKIQTEALGLDEVPLVLMYHDILDDAKAANSKQAAIDYVRANPGTALDTEPTSDVLRSDFQDQLTWLYENNYHTVTIDQFYQAMLDPIGHKLPPKSVLLTFDDGYVGNRYIKEDILKHTYDFGAVFFIHSHFTGVYPSDGSCKTDAWCKGHMTQNDLKSLEWDRVAHNNQGTTVYAKTYTNRFQIESHTWSHPALDTLIGKPGTTWDGKPTTLEREMRVPRSGLYPVEYALVPQHQGTEKLSEYLANEIDPTTNQNIIHKKIPIDYLAYPFGRITKSADAKQTEVMEAAQTAGYKMAFIIEWPGAIPVKTLTPGDMDVDVSKAWKIHNIYAIPRMEMTVDTWVHPGDSRSKAETDSKGRVITPASLSFEEQILHWKARYKETLLTAHNPENPGKPKFVGPVETLK